LYWTEYSYVSFFSVPLCFSFDSTMAWVTLFATCLVAMRASPVLSVDGEKDEKLVD
jgi:hypothetical protein